MPRRVLASVVAAMRFRIPSWGFVLTAPLVSVTKWLLLWAAVEVSLSLGRHTRFGPGLLGATIPLLVLEAWVTARRHWRIRLLHTLGFAVPAGTLVSFLSALPGSCCMCDQSPWGRMLRNVEFLGDFLYFDAFATLPAFALLVVLRRRSPSSAEDAAYRRTTLSALLATLSATFAFGGTIHALKSQFALLP